jgi:hypothetical protein
MPDRHYPSLKSWIIAGLVFTFLFAVIHVLALRFNDDILQRKQKVEASYLLRHVMQQAKQKGKDKQVVVLGSSLVGQGVSCADEFSDTTFHNIALSKIFLNTHRGVLKTFVEAKVFDSLLLHPPDILLIEVDQLAYHIEQDQTLSEQFSTGAVFLRNVKTTAAFGIANYRMPEYCGKIIHETVVDSVLETNVHWQPLTFGDHSEVHSYLDKLHKAGVRIIMIQVPRPGVADGVIHSGETEKLFLNVVNAYHQKYGMDYWNYPHLLPFSYFYDQGHLNKKGRMMYSQWLYSKLEKEIR